MAPDPTCRDAEEEKGAAMRNAHENRWTRRRYLGIGALAVLLLLVGALGAVAPAAADDAQDARQLVEKARLTLESFLADPEIRPNLLALVHKARGVMIYPQALRGAFLFGASGGNGVFLTRHQQSDTWAGPAFYSFGEASFGLQAGGQASEVVLVALTEKGVEALLTTSGKLGANASVAVGPVGVGAEAATANLSADLVSYSRNQGLYAGISVEGAIVSPRDDLARAYYGREVTPAQILVKREVANGQSAGLIAAITKAIGDSASGQRTAAGSR
jgi:lipid-binding SYLF domain-containing protein